MKKYLTIIEPTIDFAENLLTDAISKRLRSDVPMAITLSGGLDSSTIYTLIKERLNANISPFTFIHPGSPTDELHIVEQLIKDYDDKLTTVTTDHESGIKDFEESLKYLEFPIWNLSAIAYLEMYKQIHNRGIKVILEGHGSDEQLGGYSFMIYPAVLEMYKRKKYLSALQLINIIHTTDNPALDQTQPIQKIALNILKMILSAKPQKDFNQCIKDTWNYNILPMVLRTFDRLPMRSSIESRSPFLDYRVVEFFKKMPTEYKVSSIGSKAILREILKKYNKECVYKNRAKMGFALDVNSFIKVKSNQDYLHNLIKNFQTNNFDDLKIKALNNMENSDWSDVGLVWKLASISYINKIYKI